MSRLAFARAVVASILCAIAPHIGSSQGGDLLPLLERGRYSEAEREARRQLIVAEAEAGADARVADLLDIIVEAIVRRGAGGENEVRGLAERAVSLKEKLYGADAPDTAASLALLGRVLLGSDAKSAATLFERAHRIYAARMDGTHPSVSVSRGNLGMAAFQVFDLTAAEKHLEAALAGLEPYPAHRDQPWFASGLAMTLNALGRRPEAIARLEHAASMLESAYGPDHPQLVSLAFNLCVVHYDAGDHEAATAVHVRTEGLAERLLPAGHPTTGLVMNLGGLLANDRGDYDVAHTLFERARALFQQTGNPRVGLILNNIGMNRRRVADYAAARTAYEQSLALREKTVGPSHPETAAVLNNLAGLMEEMGDLTAARRYFERALQNRERYSAQSDLLARALANLARVLVRSGDLARARALLNRALALWKGHRESVVALNAMAALEWSAANHAAAKALYEQSLRLAESSGAERPDTAHAMLSLASASTCEEAVPLLERAEAIYRKVYPDGHKWIATAVAGRAHCMLAARSIASAAELSIRAAEVSLRHLEQAIQLLSERESLDLRLSVQSEIDVALSLLAGNELPDPLRARIVEAVYRTRGRVLEEIAGRHAALRMRGVPSQLIDEFRRARAELARLVVRGPGSDSPTRYQESMRRARENSDRAERALAAASAPFRQMRARRNPNLADLRAALPPGVAVVSFVRYQHYTAGPPAPLGVLRERGTPSYVAIVLRPGPDSPAAVPLGRAETIERLVEHWRREMSPVLAPSIAGYRRTGAALRSAVWDPLESHLAGVDRVFLVPDGRLALVAFAGLPSWRPGTYLAEDRLAIHYLSSERDLVGEATGASVNAGALIVGAPDFSAAPVTAPPARPSSRGSASCLSLTGLSFEPLPGSRAEADGIAKLWHARRAGEQPRPPAVLLTGARASEGEVKASIAGNRIVHLATHGFFLSESCVPVGRRVRGVGGVVTKGKPAGTERHPLRLSAVVLAGANRRPNTTSSEDGILTAEELASLDLTGTEWLVLSACETGVGDATVSEGVLGLRRAARVAGAATLIFSLWSVDDQITARWMNAVYHARLMDRLDTAAAVQRASLQILQERRAAGRSTHPVFWAGFVATGDWR